jgi:hypothetical protein
MGPTSEQFAIGSTIYYMIKGHEIYGNEWFGVEHPYANQSPLLLTVRSRRSYHFMTTSQTTISFAVLFMITRSSTVRFMVAVLDKTALMLGMLQERACSSTLSPPQLKWVHSGANGHS